jgi:hypothetical protein
MAAPKKKTPAQTKKPQSDHKLVLHVEGGEQHPNKMHKMFRGAEWKELRIDPDPALNPDYRGSLIDLSAVKDASVDAVWARHNLQRLYPHQVMATLRSFYRVLRVDGVCIFSLNNITKIAEEIVKDKLETPLYKTPIGDVTALDMLFGHRVLLKDDAQREAQVHHTAFSAATAAKALKEAGFRAIQVRAEGYNLWAAGYKLAKGHPKFDQKPDLLDYTPPAQETKMQDNLEREPKIWKPLGLAAR